MTKCSSNHDEKGFLQARNPQPEFTPLHSLAFLTWAGGGRGWAWPSGFVSVPMFKSLRTTAGRSILRAARYRHWATVAFGECRSPLCALVCSVLERFDLLACVGFSTNVDGVGNRIGQHSPNGLFPESLANSRTRLCALEKHRHCEHSPWFCCAHCD